MCLSSLIHMPQPRRAPVFRQLYSEKTVIEEERRLRVDNSPLGRWVWVRARHVY